VKYSLARATTWNLAGYLYLILASLISTRIVIKALGLTGFSQYALVVATVTLASSIDLGLSSAVVREFAISPSSRHRQIWSTSFTLFVITGLLAATIATVIVTFLRLAPELVVLTFILTLVSHLLSHYLTLPQSQGRFDLYNLKTFLVGTANTFLAALLASLGYSLPVLLGFQLGAYLVAMFILFRYTTKYFLSRHLRFSLIHAHDLLSFGLKNQFGKLLGQIGAQYAKFLLVPVSALSVSAYAIAQGVVLKLAGGLTQLTTALYPASSQARGTPAVRALYHRLQLVFLIFSCLGLVGYGFFGLAFVTWWLKDLDIVYAVHSVLRILVWYLAILVLTPLPSTILDSHGRPGLTSLFTTLTVLFEITLAVLLFPRFGLVAPSIAALTSVIITTPPLLYVTERVLTNKVKS